MSFEVPGADPAVRTQCHAFAQWFRQHGISWSGTPAELVSEISKNAQVSKVDAVLLDADRVFTFLEVNGRALSDFGVDVSLRKASGLPRSISLRSVPQVPHTAGSVAVGDVSVNQSGIENLDPKALGGSNDSSRDLDTLRGKVSGTHKQSQAKKSLDAAHPTLDEAARKTRTVKEDGIEFKYEPIDSPRPARLLAFVGVMLTFVVGFAIVTSLQNETPAGRPVTTTSRQASQWSAERKKAPIKDSTPQSKSKPMLGSTDDGNAEVTRLTREAVEQRRGASQYELGVRYAKGLGVKPDRVVGYAWLVLARSNGDRRSEGVLRALTSQLPANELQRVRLVLGDWYAHGFGVRTNYVVAHSWFRLAEISGSNEATMRKKQMEARMSPKQIQDANTMTAAWLGGH